MRNLQEASTSSVVQMARAVTPGRRASHRWQQEGSRQGSEAHGQGADPRPGYQPPLHQAPSGPLPPASRPSWSWGGRSCPPASDGYCTPSSSRLWGRWAWAVLVRPFWPAPAAAACFALVLVLLGWGGREGRIAGAQALFIMSWLQCCWAVLARQGRRTPLRVAQLCAGVLAVFILLPLHDGLSPSLGARSSFHPSVSFDEEAGPEDGDWLSGLWPGAGALIRLLTGARPPGAGQWGLEAQVDAEWHAALMRLQVALGIVLGLWVLQTALACCILPAAAANAAAAVAAAGSGPSNPAGPLGAPSPSPYAYTALLTPQKSHLDLPAIEQLDFTMVAAYDILAAGAAQASNQNQASRLEGPGTADAEAGLPKLPTLSCPAAELLPPAPSQPLPQQTLAIALGAQRLAFWVACGAQVAASAALVGVWEPPLERVALSHGVSLLSEPLVQYDSLFGSQEATWVALLALGGVMAVPLPLPSMLRSRQLLHTALLLRPATSRALGLRLLDLNAAKLLFAASVAMLVGWQSGAYSWQVLQVATLVYGLGLLYVDSLRQAADAVAPAPGAVAGEGVGGAGAMPAQLRMAESLALARPGSGTGTSSGSGCVAPPPAASSAEAPCSPCNDDPPSPSCNSSAVLLSPSSSGNSLSSAAELLASSGAATALASGPPGSCRAGPALNPAGYEGAVAAQLLARRLLPGCTASPAPSPASLGSPKAAAPADAFSSGSGTGSGGGSICPAAASAYRGSALGTSYCGPLPWPRLSAVCRAALTPWGLLLGSTCTLAALAWVALIAPPLFVMGDGPSDFFEGVMATPAGEIAVVVMLAAAMVAFLVALASLGWCAASGELRRKWRTDRAEGRRLQCIGWALGLPLAVAFALGLSWAAGDEEGGGGTWSQEGSAAAFAAALPWLVAEALRCAALFPLVWLEEPFLLGGVSVVGGCVQHAGCGVTCSVLRWAGLRPSGAPKGVAEVASEPRDRAGPQRRSGVEVAGVGTATGTGSSAGRISAAGRGLSGRRGHWGLLHVDVN
ncbi:hypothetical protein HYH03_005652 [Edaphochlamys debaryana]|uniref:Uncharacterized protein n=1 Tax=Edaphochlamys debaryana TaxID=47281 RepID=A0A835Y5L8_9CHLO|nr:hypothetical protein HYH03_005652 [Edaphochlamys debaryana]|eukprot:KAG2496428.1 hypothetical protein HYH03_005652 [Edaphochlamys debaryana]